MLTKRDFQLRKQDFKRLADLIHGRTGIVLKDSKMDMVYSRLARRLRELELSDFSDYLALIEQADSGEAIDFVNAITTNLTRFFREDHHFEHLHDHVLLPANKASGRPLFIWSAGCSSGQEPYSIAMQLRASLDRQVADRARILATDIDTSVLERARRGIYPQAEAKNTPARFQRHFKTLEDGKVEVNPDIRRHVHFRQLNLMEKWPMRQQYDAIFCRNVLIYFDKPTQHKVVSGFVELVRPGGFVYLGHSESLAANNTGLRTVGRSVFQKPALSETGRVA